MANFEQIKTNIIAKLIITMTKPLSLINFVLALFGMKLAKVTKFEVLIGKLVKKVGLIKFVQIGANDGVRFDSLYFTVTQHRWPGLVIEPLPDLFARLKNNYKDYPEVKALNIAVHPTDSLATIYRVDPDRVGECPDWAAGIASFLPDHHKKSQIPSEFIISEVVHCRPLMDVIIENDMLDASLLQIDTEGFDAEVIKMIDFPIFHPKIIKYESINLSAENIRVVESLLTTNGYRCYRCGNDTVATQI